MQATFCTRFLTTFGMTAYNAKTKAEDAAAPNATVNDGTDRRRVFRPLLASERPRHSERSEESQSFRCTPFVIPSAARNPKQIPFFKPANNNNKK